MDNLSGTLVCSLLLLAGCASEDTEKPAFIFLGVPEDQRRLAGDDNPEIDSRLAGITVMSAVRTVEWDTYEQSKVEGTIKTEEEHDGFIYFAVEEDRDVPMENASAWLCVTERYKTAVPSNH